MVWQDFFAAVGLALVFEGIFPFLSPGNARRAFEAIAGIDDHAIRMLGLLSMVAGILVLYLAR